MKDSRKIISLTDLLLLFVKINDKFISSVREFVVEATFPNTIPLFL